MIFQVKNMCKSYGEKKIFDNFNLNVEQGEFLGIVGPSGSGKTTLLSIIATLDNPNSGTIIFNKQNLTTLLESEIALLRNKEFGFIFQQSNMLMHLDVYENIALPFYYNEKLENINIKNKVKYYLGQVGLSGYERKQVRYLSGGEQQRVAIARALVNNPKIIFADEPTGNLDELNSIQVLELLKTQVEKEKKTLIIVTHDPLVVKYCSRVIKLEKIHD